MRYRAGPPLDAAHLRAHPSPVVPLDEMAAVCTNGARPTYPVKVLLTADEAARLRPDAMVHFGGFQFVRVRGTWALVDVLPADDA